MPYSPKKNKKIWNFVILASILAIFVVGLIVFNMSKDRSDDDNSSSSSLVSSTESISIIDQTENVNTELEQTFEDPDPVKIIIGQPPTPPSE